MKILEDKRARILILFSVFLIVNVYVFIQNRGVPLSEGVNEYDDIVFAAAEVDSAILDYISDFKKGVPDSLNDLDLSEPLKEVLEVEHVGLKYKKLSATEYELIIEGLDNMPIVYKKISPQDYELLVKGLEEEPIVFAGGDGDHEK